MERSDLYAISLQSCQNHCLIGKILLHRALPPSMVQSFLQRQWNCKTGLTVTPIKRNMFIFIFQDGKDIAHVMENRPWTVLGGLLILTVCTPGKIPDGSQFLYSHFWVQAHGLPTDYLTRENGSKIGSMIGMYVDSDLKILDWKKFLRVRVILDVRKPLMSGFWLKRVGFMDVWVEFKYGNLGVFCYKCGRIGNSYRNCKFPAGIGTCGPWIRAGSGYNSLGSSLILTRVENICTNLIPMPKPKKGLIQSSTNHAICGSMEFEIRSDEAQGIKTRNLLQRLILNSIDSMTMLLNCGIIFSRVTSVVMIEENWTLFMMMAAYLCHLFLKFIRVIQHSRFISKGEIDLIRFQEGNGKALKEILVLVMFLFLLACF